MGERISFEVPGSPVEAYISGSGTPILVLHAWWGLAQDFLDIADWLAGEGFLALVPDLCEGAVVDTVEEAERHQEELDESALDATVLSALDTLLAHPAAAEEPAGVVGFSMGASWALWLSSIRPQVGAAVAFYGSYQGTALAEGTAPVLGHYAPGDEWEPEEELAAMRRLLDESGRDVEWHVYPGTRHWFFEPSREAYDAAAVDLARRRTLEFLHRHLRQR